MSKRNYVVRVTTPKQKDEYFATGLTVAALLESFRYAGLIRFDRNNPDTMFYLICPQGLISEVWANQNAQRMRTFGFDAMAVETPIK